MRDSLPEPSVVDDLNQLPDAELMRAAQAGESQAFALLTARYQAALRRVARSRLGRDDWAEEAAQETLMAALRSRHTYDPARGFRTWLWTILLNQCTAVRRRQTRAGRVANWTDISHESDCVAERAGEAPLERHAIEPGESPLASLLAKERAESLDRLLSQLPENQADALRLRFFASLKYEEIADAVDCSLLTAKNRVKGGLLRLAGLLRHSDASDVRAGDERSSDSAT